METSYGQPDGGKTRSSAEGSQEGAGGSRSSARSDGTAQKAAEAAGKDSRSTFIENYINDQLKHGAVAAKNDGIDPALYETEEWKAHAQAYAEAAYATHQADGSAGIPDKAAETE